MKLIRLLWIMVAVAIFATRFPSIGMSDHLPTCAPCCDGIIEKAPGDQFAVDVVFKNTGQTEGNWLVNVVFEGRKWTWNGTGQNLALSPSCSKKLSWNGYVPADAPVDSIARLVVYYEDSYKALDWWIHVVSEAELAIIQSVVK